jgi:hypothetical protein
VVRPYHAIAFTAIGLIIAAVIRLRHALSISLLAAMAWQGLPAAEEPPADDVLCGPDIVTLGDAWEKVQLQSRDARHLLDTGDVTRFPQKLAAIAAHLRFMQRNAIMLFGKRRTRIDQGMSVLSKLRDDMNAAVLNGVPTELAEPWIEWEAGVKFIAAQFPDEALLPSTSFAHLLPPVQPILHMQLEALPAPTPGQPIHLKFQLVRLKDLSPVGPDDLITTHEAPLHALVCDRLLTDYHHAHPTPTGKPGEWEFTFTPQHSDEYHLWINAVPSQTGREEFPMNIISQINPNVAPTQIIRDPALTSTFAGLTGQITWNGGDQPETNRPISGTLHLAQPSGEPVADLEPFMGAFAHIVGFADDFRTVLHVHPEGAIPAPADRSGPDIDFTLRPTRPGFHRLFVQVQRQVQRQGQIQQLAFGVIVK